jgi:metallo-beta-lactamase class B
MRLSQTTGRAVGTVSLTLEVKTGGKAYRAVIWGGTGFNVGRDL